jgi:glycerol uptake facilitator-like aquaporin
LGAEIVFSVILVLVFLHVQTTKKLRNNAFFGLSMGITYTAASLSSFAVSGSVFNPAVGTGPSLIHAIIHNGSLQFLWVYWIGPLCGSIIGAALFRILNVSEYDPFAYTEINTL